MSKGELGQFTYEVRPYRLRCGDEAWLWEIRLNGRLVDAGAALHSAERAEEMALAAIRYASGETLRSA